jgi:hypothetical protein
MFCALTAGSNRSAVMAVRVGDRCENAGGRPRGPSFFDAMIFRAFACWGRARQAPVFSNLAEGKNE